MTYKIIENLCKGCGKCTRFCPVGAISRKENGKFIINEQICIGCGKCVKVCPPVAIVLNKNN